MKKMLTILFSTLAFTAYSQHIRLTYETGYGLYGLQKLKKLQETLTQQVNGLPVKMIAQFPDYFNHSATLGLYLDKNVIFGFNASYMSTGGRNHIRDYSGEYKLDLLLHAYQFGMESEYIYNMSKKWDMNFNMKMGVVTSVLDVTENLVVYQLEGFTDRQKASQLSIFLEPNLNVTYNITKAVALKAGLGINLNTVAFQGSMLDWTGLRPRAGVAFSL